MIKLYSSDQELLTSLKQGNKRALESLFHEHYDALCNKAYQYVFDIEVSKDLVQELFIAIWDQRKKLEIKSSWGAYLSTATKNRALNYLRGLHSFTSLEKVENEADNADVILALEGQELDSIIKKAIAQLPPKCRSIFLLSRKADMSQAQIAQELNISKKTVEYHVGVALQRIQSFLENNWIPIVLFIHFFLN